MRRFLLLDNLGKVVMLQRSDERDSSDPRVSYVKFDAERPHSVSEAMRGVYASVKRVHLLVNSVGMLHSARQQPEKKLSRVDPDNLQRAFLINATLLPVLAQNFSSLLRHDDPAVFASLSARVGSIEENRLGGWYSYRASKAAHNMLLRTIAHEWRLSHRNAAVVALHPGTVRSPLSSPFISPHYKNTVHTPAECADYLMRVLDNLRTEASGGFYDWEGNTIAW
ncbi:MAG: SDR family NAD(P)-dependent oxidoreductase [Halioglobus sp.]|nr:SDR family NAD(P)-dependent oxidoreductase [Halioglobus sp.]